MTSSLEHSFRKAGTKKQTLEGPFYSRRRTKMKALAWIDAHPDAEQLALLDPDAGLGRDRGDSALADWLKKSPVWP